MEKQSVSFGPSGNDGKFYELGNKSSKEAPKYLSDLHLSAYEYGFSRGVNLSREGAIKLGELFANEGITLSVHAPYFINFASPEEMKVEASIGYLSLCMQYAEVMLARSIVFHPASLTKLTREEAFRLTKENLERFIYIIESDPYVRDIDVNLCIETMGKHGQIGTLDEVLQLCAIDSRFKPCIDFGHINSYTQGGLKTEEDYVKIFDKIKNFLGEERANNLHIHFSKIHYGEKGEIKHLNFEDEGEPDPEVFLRALKKSGLSAVVICESRGNQCIDSVTMKNYYNTL